jgi:insertion element IS1 protein InsB
MPPERHNAMTKKPRNTHHVERFNTTLRPRVSRLVREPLAFAKQVAHHMGAMQLFIGHSNLTRVGA